MSTSVAVYKEQNRKLNEKLETEILGDADKQAIIDQINENNRIATFSLITTTGYV